MSITTVSSRELNQDIGRAKRAALEGPVFITDRGKPAHVLLCIEDYQRLVGNTGTLAQALAGMGQHAADGEHGADEGETVAVLEGQFQPDDVAGDEMRTEKQEHTK